VNWVFWVIVVVLIGLALGFVILPLLRQSRITTANAEQRNVAIAKERLTELKNQQIAGLLSEAQYKVQREELELALLDDLSDETDRASAFSQGRWMAGILGALMPLLILALYAGLGEPDALEKSARQSAFTANDVNAMIEKLAQRLQTQPDDPEGWFMLARSYKVMKRFDKASEAFARLHELLPNDAEVMLHYADALAMSTGSLTGQPAELIFRALSIQPANETGLWLAGMVRAEERKFTEAVLYWKKLIGILPSDSDSVKELQNLIAAAEKELQQQTQIVETDTAESPAPNGPLIHVSVVVAETLRSKIAPDDTVFVYARASSGPRMPLAVVRKTGADIPFTVTLDDSMAMSPDLKISQFKGITLNVMVSKSGQAKLGHGDLFGEMKLGYYESPVNVEVIVNQIVP
jgi:cytochrome c-type biogenesis protein CcmH